MTIFIKKGQKPLTTAEANTRGSRYFNGQLAQWQREAGIVTQDPSYLAWAAQWLADNVENTANNKFNRKLEKYKSALARLDQYRLADGRAEVIEQVENGETDEDGNDVTEPVVTVTAIDPVDAEVEVVTYDDAGEQTSTQMVTNPLIVQDDAERAVSQTVIDGMSADVVTYYNAQVGG